ncbi:MAG: hypothetical protein AAF183_24290 [Pseudomonadota bacterium]
MVSRIRLDGNEPLERSTQGCVNRLCANVCSELKEDANRCLPGFGALGTDCLDDSIGLGALPAAAVVDLAADKLRRIEDQAVIAALRKNELSIVCETAQQKISAPRAGKRRVNRPPDEALYRIHPVSLIYFPKQEFCGHD